MEGEGELEGLAVSERESRGEAESERDTVAEGLWESVPLGEPLKVGPSTPPLAEGEVDSEGATGVDVVDGDVVAVPLSRGDEDVEGEKEGAGERVGEREVESVPLPVGGASEGVPVVLSVPARGAEGLAVGVTVPDD